MKEEGRRKKEEGRRKRFIYGSSEQLKTKRPE
jgi:hypothetical protein